MFITSIPHENLAMLTANIEKLKKKAIKLSTGLPTLTIGKTFFKEIGKSRDGTINYRQMVEVTVDGNPPIINGWTFIGSIEAIETGNIIRSIPGYSIPESYRNSTPYTCDHCSVNRYRKMVYIVFNQSTGEYKQVGRSCLKDFTGHGSPEALASYAEMVMGIISHDINNYESEGGYSGKSYFDTRQMVINALNIINHEGCFRKSDDEYPTKQSMVDYICNSEKGELQIINIQYGLDHADAALEYLQNLSGNEFAINTSLYAKAKAIDVKAFGYIAAGVNQYIKSISDRKAAKVKEVINDQPIGQPGLKVKITGKVISAIMFERNQYHYYDSGCSQILMIKTDDNQLIKMFSSNLDIKEDSMVQISGKLKDSIIESYEKSRYKGCLINQFAPRTRITVI